MNSNQTQAKPPVRWKKADSFVRNRHGSFRKSGSFESAYSPDSGPGTQPV
jgi:hypothetical protein